MFFREKIKKKKFEVFCLFYLKKAIKKSYRVDKDKFIQRTKNEKKRIGHQKK